MEDDPNIDGDDDITFLPTPTPTTVATHNSYAILATTPTHPFFVPRKRKTDPTPPPGPSAPPPPSTTPVPASFVTPAAAHQAAAKKARQDRTTAKDPLAGKPSTTRTDFLLNPPAVVYPRSQQRSLSTSSDPATVVDGPLQSASTAAPCTAHAPGSSHLAATGPPSTLLEATPPPLPHGPSMEDPCAPHAAGAPCPSTPAALTPGLQTAAVPALGLSPSPAIVPDSSRTTRAVPTPPPQRRR